MRVRRHLTYANVASTLALVLAAGAGGAYAVDQIGSGDIRNDSIRSKDLRDGSAVTGKDVQRNSLGSRAILERSLVASAFVRMAGDRTVTCPLVADVRVVCAQANVRLSRRGRILAIGSGAFSSSEDTASAVCRVTLGGGLDAFGVSVGQTDPIHAGENGDGFSRTSVTGVLPPGTHEVALECEQIGSPAVTIDGATLAALGVTGR